MNRIEKLQQYLAESQLDGILLTSMANRRYISGFTGDTGTGLVTPTQAVLLVDGRYTTEAKHTAPDFEVITYKDAPYETLKGYGFKKLAIEENYLTLSVFNKLKEAIPETEFCYADKTLSDMRIVKEQYELDAIGAAAAIADKAFAHIIERIKPGMTEKQLTADIEHFMLCNGADDVAFDTILVAGENTALPHGRPGNRPIGHGDFVTMDFGCMINGYRSDMTRTVVIGSATDEQRRCYNAVLAAQQAALSALRDGVECKAVDDAARKPLEEAGLVKNFVHGLGHGVGLEIHENPYMSQRSKESLKENMVVTVEPGIYIEGFGGVRIEDMVYITQNGHVNFVKSTKDLMII